VAVAGMDARGWLSTPVMDDWQEPASTEVVSVDMRTKSMMAGTAGSYREGRSGPSGAAAARTALAVRWGL
jgi:hypothetical protein